MPTEQSLRQFAQLPVIGIVVVGCYRVLLPFIPAILFAVVACISIWPLHERLRRVLREKSRFAA
jgi:predicted PurR-regulated permease PerM